MSEALKIIQDPTLTYKQELLALARLGESTDDSLRYSDEYYEAKRKGALVILTKESCLTGRAISVPIMNCSSKRAVSFYSWIRRRIFWKH